MIISDFQKKDLFVAHLESAKFPRTATQELFKHTALATLIIHDNKSMNKIGIFRGET